MSTELPWDEPTTGCSEFVTWKSDNSYLTISPWNKLETLALSLLRKILDPESTKRITLDKMMEHKWCMLKTSGKSNGSENCHFYLNPTFIVLK